MEKKLAILNWNWHHGEKNLFRFILICCLLLFLFVIVAAAAAVPRHSVVRLVFESAQSFNGLKSHD